MERKPDFWTWFDGATASEIPETMILRNASKAAKRDLNASIFETWSLDQLREVNIWPGYVERHGSPGKYQRPHQSKEVDISARMAIKHVGAEDLPLDLAKGQAKAQVESRRDALLRAGESVTFPDGTGTVQTRDERDLINIMGVIVGGIALVVQGDDNGTVGLRDATNTDHAMTGVQALQVGMQALLGQTVIYQASWDHKAAIEAVDTLDDLKALDLESGWPASPLVGGN